MNNVATVEPNKIGCMNSIRNIAKKAIKEKGLSDYEIRKSLGSWSSASPMKSIVKELNENACV